MNTGYQNKYDSVLKIQFRNNVGMGKGGTTLNLIFHCTNSREN